MTARLPIPGSDNDIWGTILNQFLEVSLNGDGTIQPAAIQQAGGVTAVNGINPTDGNLSLATTDLSDTAITDPTSDQLLTWDGTTNKWVNQSPASGVALNTSASTIQPLGTQTAGTTGEAADAGHVHAMPSLDQVNAPVSPVSLNSQKITNLANGSLATDAAAYGQIPDVGSTAVGGDVSGTVNDVTVTHLQGQSVSTTTPGTNQFLYWNGSTWIPIGLGQLLEVVSGVLAISGAEGVNSIGSSGSSITLANPSVTIGNETTLSANCTVTMPSGSSGLQCWCRVKQAASDGPYTVTFSGVTWPNGTQPTQSTGAGDTDLYQFAWDSLNNVWQGSALQDFS